MTSAKTSTAVAGHRLRNRQRLERGVGDLLAFVGDAHFVAQLIFNALHPKARAYMRHNLANAERPRDRVVGAQIERVRPFV